MRSPRFRRSGSGAPAIPRIARPSAPASRPGRALAPAAVALLLALGGCGGSDDSSATTGERFDSAAAFDLIEDQVGIGPRPAGSAASRRLAQRLRAALPNGAFEPVPGGLRNVVGTLPGAQPAILVGAHYDTESHPPGFVGANDGAAGTAAVVELARALSNSLPDAHREVRFVLFDGEEEPPGCPEARFAECALRGSRAYAAAHPGQVGQMILLDYVANEGLRIPRELNSDADLWAQLRAAAVAVGAERVFPDAEQGPIIDDHVPFLARGVPSIDLIDFSYRYRDTVEDTPDKLSEADLEAVGEAVAELVHRLAGS